MTVSKLIHNNKGFFFRKKIETLKIYIKEDWKTIPNKTVNKDIEENKAEIKQLKKAIVILKEVDKKCII